MRSALSIALVTLLSGCVSLSGLPTPSVDAKKELAALQPYLDSDVLAKYDGLADRQKQEYRNEIILARVRAIDINYYDFLQSLSIEDKKLNIATDTATILLGAAGALSTVSSTQSIESAASGSISGIKSSIDKNTYYDQTVPALVAQMNASRSNVLVTIYSGLVQDPDKYPLLQGLKDLDDYYRAGTIQNAADEISKTSGVQKQAADKALTSITTKYAPDDTSTKIRDFWQPGGVVNADHQTLIQQWLQKNNLDISIPTFIYGDYKSDRAKAVNEIPIP